MKKISVALYLLIFGSALILDRVTKYLVMISCKSIILTPFLSIDLVYNRGISWGLFHDISFMAAVWMNVLIGLIIAALIVHGVSRILKKKNVVGEVLIFAGAISNYADRFFYPGVVDFIAFAYQGWYFPIFNIADICIVLGVCMMLFLEYQQPCKN